MIANNFYVYVFLRTDKNGSFDYGDGLYFDYEPFYVGKGINDRIKLSLKEKMNNSIKQHIIDKIHRKNMEIKSIKIKENLSEFEAFEYEKYVINKIGKILTNNGPLSNMADGGQGYSGVPVIQYNISGEFIKEFSSIGEAVTQTGIKNISPCCRGLRKMAGKYIWKYKMGENYPKSIDVGFIKNMTHFGNYERSVIQLDMNYNFIEEFRSIKEASIKSGCNSGHIVSVCKGDRKSTKGYIWKYKNIIF